MLSLNEFTAVTESYNRQLLDESNLLQQRVNKHISKGVSVGAISPEGPHTNTKEKLEQAHKVIKSDLEEARKAGHIGGWSGPHKGQYKYEDSNDVDSESSYLVHAVHPGENAHHRMVGALSRIGIKHNQESVLSINANKEAKWHYLKGEKEGKSEDRGTLRYNRELKGGSGQTAMKRGNQSFTSS